MMANVKLPKWWLQFEPLETLGSVTFLLAATLYEGKSAQKVTNQHTMETL
jgi:hypothetical protein